MTGPKYFSKDPDSVLDYSTDWSAWMAADDSIATSSWTVPTGLTKTTDTHDATTATAWFTGGTLGTQYTVVNRITTAQGRTEDQTLVFSIADH